MPAWLETLMAFSVILASTLVILLALLASWDFLRNYTWGHFDGKGKKRR